MIKTLNLANLLHWVGFVSYSLFLMTSASIYHSINWLTTVHMGLMSATGFVASFVEVLTYMPDENKYVLRHEWVKSNGDIYERLTKMIKEHQRNRRIKTKIETQTTLQRQTYEAQKERPITISKI